MSEAVLIIEDDEDQAFLLQKKLHPFFSKVVHYDSLPVPRSVADQEYFAVLLDLHLEPEKDAKLTIKQFKEQFSEQHYACISFRPDKTPEVVFGDPYYCGTFDKRDIISFSKWVDSLIKFLGGEQNISQASTSSLLAEVELRLKNLNN